MEGGGGEQNALTNHSNPNSSPYRSDPHHLPLSTSMDNINGPFHPPHHVALPPSPQSQNPSLISSTEGTNYMTSPQPMQMQSPLPPQTQANMMLKLSGHSIPHPSPTSPYTNTYMPQQPPPTSPSLPHQSPSPIPPYPHTSSPHAYQQSPHHPMSSPIPHPHMPHPHMSPHPQMSPLPQLPQIPQLPPQQSPPQRAMQNVPPKPSPAKEGLPPILPGLTHLLQLCRVNQSLYFSIYSSVLKSTPTTRDVVRAAVPKTIPKMSPNRLPAPARGGRSTPKKSPKPPPLERSPPVQRRVTREGPQYPSLAKCEKLLNALMKHKDVDPFLEPVDAEEMGIPEYYDIIKEPMDLSTIKKKFKGYKSSEELVKDVELMWRNARTFNPEGHWIRPIVNTLDRFFSQGLRDLRREEMAEEADTYVDDVASKIDSPGITLRPKKKNQVYNFDNDDDDDDFGSEDELDSRIIVKGEKASSDDEDTDRQHIEKIMLRRLKKREAKQGEERTQDKSSDIEDILDENEKEKEDTDDYEYYVKWTGKCYRKCEWITRSRIEELGKGALTKLRNFLKRDEQLAIESLEDTNVLSLEDTPFNTDYLEVDRILAHTRDTELVEDEENPNAEDSKEEEPKMKEVTVDKFLVKWKSLPYSEATWERLQDLQADKPKIEEFSRFRQLGLPPRLNPSMPQLGWANIRPAPRGFQGLPPLMYKNENQLREYQQEGLNWLIFCWYQHRSCILADEMGLGKTIQCICFLEYLWKFERMRGPFLVVAPLSTIPNWAREFEAWSNLNVVLYQGRNIDREMIRQYEWHFQDDRGNPIMKEHYKFNVVLTSYELTWLPIGTNSRR